MRLKNNIKKLWIESFLRSLAELEGESNTKTDTEWTRFMNKVMESVGKKTDCYVVNKFSAEKKYRGEYLNMDAMFIANSVYENWNSDYWDPPVLPKAVVELENAETLEKITYCLWKIICIRAELRVLICYQSNKDKVRFLISRLENTIISRNLMENTNGDLLIIVGNDAMENSSWKNYFNFFEWKNEKLENAEAFK